MPPNELHAVTAMHQTVGFVVAYSSGEHYQMMREDATSFLVTPAPTHIGGTEMLIRDGKMSGQHGNGIVYGAGDPTYKMLNQESILPIDTEASQTIGYCDWLSVVPIFSHPDPENPQQEVPCSEAQLYWVVCIPVWTRNRKTHCSIPFNPAYWDSYTTAMDASAEIDLPIYNNNWGDFSEQYARTPDNWNDESSHTPVHVFLRSTPSYNFLWFSSVSGMEMSRVYHWRQKKMSDNKTYLVTSGQGELNTTWRSLHTPPAQYANSTEPIAAITFSGATAIPQWILVRACPYSVDALEADPAFKRYIPGVSPSNPTTYPYD